MKKVIHFLVCCSVSASCTLSKDTLIGTWSGRGTYKYKYDNSSSEYEGCALFTFEILKTKSNRYFGNGTLNNLDCSNSDVTESLRFTMNRIEIDDPIIYFEITMDNDPMFVRYKFTGTLTENLIEGKMSTFTSSSDNFSTSFAMEFRQTVD